MKPTILVVADDPETQTLMRLVLCRRYQVLVAANGQQARHELSGHEGVRLVVMDLRLAGKEDGATLTRALREDARWTDVPIIATTATGRHADRSRAISAGCTAFLPKPFYPHELLTLVGRYVRA